VLFIGTEFSILLITSTPPCIRQPGLCIRVLGVCDRVQVCTQAFIGFLAFELLVNMPPLTLWLSHFALCPSYLPQTPPRLAWASPPLRP
jgi:hypothetical protein